MDGWPNRAQHSFCLPSTLLVYCSIILITLSVEAFDMSFTEKIDVLDLLIEILSQHEKKLDALVTRLEEAIEARPSRDISQTLV